MANSNRQSDANATAASLVAKSTGSTPSRGEDLIGDPKLRAEFIALKKKAAKKKP